MGQLEKKCIGCGKTFTVSAKNQVYCTVECRENERRKRHAEKSKKRKKYIWEKLPHLMIKQSRWDLHMDNI